jgi:hypothetical protein
VDYKEALGGMKMSERVFEDILNIGIETTRMLLRVMYVGRAIIITSSGVRRFLVPWTDLIFWIRVCTGTTE